MRAAGPRSFKDRLKDGGRRFGVAPFVLFVAALVPPPNGGSLLGLPGLCGFRHLTGLPCPGCGLTRSLVCSCHLRLGEAVAFHPFGPVLALGLVVVALLRLTGREERLRPHAYEAAVGVFLAGLLVFWAVRLLHFAPWPPP